MPFERRSTTLGEICKVQGGSIQTGPFGSQLHTSDYKKIGVPVVMPTNIADGGIVDDSIARISEDDANRLSQHILLIGDIVFSRRGDVTKNALIGEREVGWLCGTGCLKVRLGEQVIANTKFISYYLRLPEIKEWLIRHAVGATMPNLNTGILSSVPIGLLSLESQIDIADLLGSLDDRILLLRETNKTLESIAQAIFKSWFVDFDPVRAKMEGRQPEGMDKETAALFPDEFEESELGNIPKGWRVGKVNELLQLHKGAINPGSQPFVDFQYFSLPSFDTGQMPTIEPGEAIKSNKTIVPANAVLLSKLNPRIPRVWLPSKVTNNAICSTEFLPLVPSKNSTTAFSYCLLTHPSLLGQLVQLATGTSNSHQRIKPDNILSMPYVIPPANLIHIFDKIASTLLEKLKLNRVNIHALASLRDTILPRLISGQLLISDVTEMAERDTFEQ